MSPDCLDYNMGESANSSLCTILASPLGTAFPMSLFCAFHMWVAWAIGIRFFSFLSVFVHVRVHEEETATEIFGALEVGKSVVMVPFSIGRGRITVSVESVVV